MNRAILKSIREQCRQLSDSDTALNSQRFFKTGPGEYGEGDVFLGIRTPALRKIAKNFDDTPVATVSALLKSRYHEERYVALSIWIMQFAKGSHDERKIIFNAYLDHTHWINNWDLVDVSAHKIVGAYLSDKEPAILYSLAQSKSLWERRIAVVATLAFINKNHFSETLSLAEMLLNDREDLIHKAVGWMLREIRKRDVPLLLAFLKPRYKIMPRTMLRYAIEHFDQSLRQKFLSGDI
jgi:3-methyladenine DNA glycosylase AlkD